MYNGGKITIGLIIFLAIVTLPFYVNIGKANLKPDYVLETEAIKNLDVKKCIEPVEFMRANHMRLLRKWMNDLQNKDIDTYTASDGKTYDASFDTCLECHESQAKFCDRCHFFAGVQPYCWKCHELE